MDEESKEYKLEDWQRHYDANDLGWDLGQVAPPFVKLWEEGKLPLGKVLVPGCGRGHEVIFLAENGFEVTGIDYSEGAVTYLENTLKERNLEGRVLHQDFFSLDDTHDGVYDLVIEQTPDDLIALDEALEKLAQQDPIKADLVKLRYFAGLTNEQAASSLGITPRIAERNWTYARTWLLREIRKGQ